MKKLSLTALSLFSAISVFAQIKSNTAKIDTGKTFQTIESFAASDAWSGNFVGKFFSDANKEQMAKWLFSQKFGEDGSPEGIGLSLWRVNLGGGSWEQNGADIVPIQRRAESFLAKDGVSYDWSKAAGQQYFMKKAKEYGCSEFLLFSNTPPVQMTQNGKGYKSVADYTSNLRADKYDDFAAYLADVADHFIKEGFDIKYISPINEPSWRWSTNAQEGCPYTNPQIKRVALELDKAILKRNLKTQMLLIEASPIQRLYGYDRHDKANKNPQIDLPANQLYAFYDPQSRDYIGHLKTLPRKMTAHAYHNDEDNTMMVERRKLLKDALDKYGVTYMQSEWCLLPGVTCKEGMPKKGFSDMDVALLMTKLIHCDMTIPNATSWGYWKAMEIKGDYALTSLFPKDGDICQGGEIASKKLLWALGNYSFFIRPDWKRVQLEGVNNLEGVYASAYISPDGKKLAVVAGNIAYAPEDLKISMPESQAKKFAKVSIFQTSKSTNLAKIGQTSAFINDAPFRLPARSVTTLLLESAE